MPGPGVLSVYGRAGSQDPRELEDHLAQPGFSVFHRVPQGCPLSPCPPSPPFRVRPFPASRPLSAQMVQPGAEAPGREETPARRVRQDGTDSDRGRPTPSVTSVVGPVSTHVGPRVLGPDRGSGPAGRGETCETGNLRGCSRTL